jgi:lipopolysaccharide biosynthesis protein
VLAAVGAALGRRLSCSYRERLPLREEVLGRAVALFAHYDADGRVADHVRHHLACLRAAGVAPLLVTTARLAPSDLDTVAPLCAAVLERENVGLDFGSWRTALLVYPRLFEAGLLLFVNDSVYGPVGDLGRALARLEQAGGDFFGMSESLEIERHYQSYFLGFRRTALASAAFRAFCDDMLLLHDKDEIIRRYEVGLRRRLTDGGLAGRALVPAGADLLPTENPTLHRWRELLAAGAPYVKVQLLRDNPHRQAIDDWPAVVRGYGYDPALVYRHLGRHLAGATARI